MAGARGLIGVLGLALAQTAQAATFSETRGGWEIGGGDDSCYMAMEYEGPGETLLLFIKYADGQIGSAISNYGWSAEKGVGYPISYVLNGVEFGGAEATGTSGSGRNGFISLFQPDFETHFRRGSTLHVYLKDERIDQLSLAGTAVALDALNRCLVEVRAEIAAIKREQERWSHLPKDPFAQRKPPSEAQPRGNQASWVTPGDYPSAALREGRSGRVGYSLQVGTDGRVTKCAITSSSGHDDLDTATCELLQRRARFAPAIGEDGNPIVGSWTRTVNWTIPN